MCDERLPREVLLRNHAAARIVFQVNGSWHELHAHSCDKATELICASFHANVLAMVGKDGEIFSCKMENDKENVHTNFVAGIEKSYEQTTSNAKRFKPAEVSKVLQSSVRATEKNGDHIVDGDFFVLDTHKNTNEKIIVHPEFVKRMEKHQVEGLEFMYKCCFNDLNAKRKYRRQDHGCILAHCMGLGKTLQLIGLLHTAITYPQLETNRILIICPKSTVLNWIAEMERWLRPIDTGRKFKLFTFPEAPLVLYVDFFVHSVYFN